MAPLQIIPVNLSVGYLDGVLGDVNQDSFVNVTDIVTIVTFILNYESPNTYEFWASDMNNDGSINVVDIVAIIDFILGSM